MRLIDTVTHYIILPDGTKLVRGTCKAKDFQKR